MTSQSIFYLLDPRHKPSDNQWHYIKNLHFKQPDGWHQHWNYKWATKDWGACSEPCEGGIQLRPLQCVRSDGLDRSDVFCADITKPVISQPCNPQSCIYWHRPQTSGLYYNWYYGRKNSGSRADIFLTTYKPINFSFGMYASDLCNKGTAYFTVETYNHNTGAWATLANSGSALWQWRICDDWDLDYFGRMSVNIYDTPCDVYIRGVLSGHNNCCREIKVYDLAAYRI